MAVLEWRDLLQLAVSMEERGRDFYIGLAGQAPNKEAAEIFRQLAAEEEEHAALFRRGLPDGGIGFGQEQAAYLEALGRTNLFAVDSGATGDPRRALGVAIEAEKESILFYTELAAMTPGGPARETLDRLLKAEKLHLVELRDRLEEDWS